MCAKQRLSKRKFTKNLMDWFFDDSCQDGVDFKVAVYKAIKYGEENAKAKCKKEK
jgi:hypothetical protein